MALTHWSMLGVITLLLLGEITISQLCKSLIIMVDGFHTLFILIHMALPLPRTARVIKPQFFSDSPASHSHASSSSEALPGSPQITSPSSAAKQSDESNHKAPSLVSSPATPPAAPNCSLSFSSSRIQAVGVFISALLLASLCVSYFLEIISHILEPHPVQLPLLPVLVGAVSLLCKVLLFVLNWDQKSERCNQMEAESHLQINHTAPTEQAGGDSQGQGEAEHIVQSKLQSAEHDSHPSGALVLCNPGTSSVPDSDCKNQGKQEILCDTESRAAGLNSESRSNFYCCHGHPGGHNSSKTSSVCESSPLTETPVQGSCRTICILSFIFVIQGLLTSLLAVINSLVTLFIVPQLLHCSPACSVLVYLDPGLSLLAVVTLIATTVPQVYRFGLLLLQASPPHVSVSDLRQRITSVPGVQDVHDLHIWQLTESLTVASVHVHCYAGFPVQRCADLMSSVTKVLQSVGVSCCTVQPEFASGSPSFSDPPIPPLPACSLACGTACAANMCCSLLEEETWSVLRPPAVETREEPQNLVIKNTFL